MTAVDTGSSGTAGTVDSKGLKGGSLGLLSSIVVGMASTAPAYVMCALRSPGGSRITRRSSHHYDGRAGTVPGHRSHLRQGSSVLPPTVT